MPFVVSRHRIRTAVALIADYTSTAAMNCWSEDGWIREEEQSVARNLLAMTPNTRPLHTVPTHENDYAFHWLNGLGKPQNSFIHHNAK